MEGTRQSLRYPVTHRRDCPLYIITFKHLEWQECNATLVDIGKQGVGLESDAKMEPGFVWFRGRLGGFRGGVLMWCRKEGAKYRAGIRFIPLTAGEEQMIHEQVDLMRTHKPMQKPEAVISTIMESFTRTCGSQGGPDPVTSPERGAGQGIASEDDIVGQLRSLLSDL